MLFPPEDELEAEAPEADSDDEEETSPGAPHPLMDLVHRLRQGDTVARDALMMRWYHLGELRARKLNRGRVPDSVLDELKSQAIVDTLDKALRGKITTNPNAAYLSTLAGLISNKLRSTYRDAELARKAEEGAYDPAELLARGLTPSEMESRVALLEAFEALDEEQQVLLTLIERDGMTAEEAAAALGLSKRSCQRYLAEARARVLDHVNRKKPEPKP